MLLLCCRLFPGSPLVHQKQERLLEHESWRQAGDILTVLITTVKIVQGAEVEDEADPHAHAHAAASQGRGEHGL
mgnify:CR=1 FL=1